MRYQKISAELFKRNRKKLISKLEKDSIAIIHSNDQMVRSGDQYFNYRQSSDMLYLTGIEQEMSVLVIFPGEEKDREILFIRKPDPLLETWEGTKLDKKSAAEISGIDAVYFLEDFQAVTRPKVFLSRIIYFNTWEYLKFKPEYPLRDQRKMDELRKDYPSHEYKRLYPILAKLRTVKEPEEHELVRKAVSVTRDAYIRVLGFVRPGVMEYEVEAEMTHEFIRQGCGGHAYPPIIAAGGNACKLHYIKNDQPCLEGQMLLMDFGAEYANYASDCTRTIPVSGKFNKRQKELYFSTLKVFREACKLLKPGTSIEKINEATNMLWQQEHLRLGLYTEEDVKRQDKRNPVVKKYYPHGTSHFVGLDVHDVGTWQETLRPGMILTCEPAIYIPEEEVGIRLETDLLITENGNIDLMEDFPIEMEEIEDMMNRGK